MIKLTVQSYNGTPLPQALSAQFDELGGSIGRADNNQLVLPDPERSISRVHAQVVFRNGGYALVDRGSNPVLVDGRALGNGVEAMLSGGEQLQIGGYLIRVDKVAGGSASPGTGSGAADPFGDLGGMAFSAPPAPPRGGMGGLAAGAGGAGWPLSASAGRLRPPPIPSVSGHPRVRLRTGASAAAHRRPRRLPRPAASRTTGIPSRRSRPRRPSRRTWPARSARATAWGWNWAPRPARR